LCSSGWIITYISETVMKKGEEVGPPFGGILSQNSTLHIRLMGEKPRSSRSDSAQDKSPKPESNKAIDTFMLAAGRVLEVSDGLIASINRRRRRSRPFRGESVWRSRRTEPASS